MGSPQTEEGRRVYTERDVIHAKALHALMERVEQIETINKELQTRLLYMEGYNEFLSMKILELKGEAQPVH